MRINGQQFYWLIATGLVVGVALAVASAVPEIDKSILAVLALPLMPLVFAAYVIVAFEIWDRFGPSKAVVAFVLFPISVVYWFSRIDGIEKASNDA